MKHTEYRNCKISTTNYIRYEKRKWVQVLFGPITGIKEVNIGHKATKRDCRGQQCHRANLDLALRLSLQMVESDKGIFIVFTFSNKATVHNIHHTESIWIEIETELASMYNLFWREWDRVIPNHKIPDIHSNVKQPDCSAIDIVVASIQCLVRALCICPHHIIVLESMGTLRLRIANDTTTFQRDGPCRLQRDHPIPDVD